MSDETDCDVPPLHTMIQVIVRPGGKRRVVLLWRTDGRFTFIEQAGYDVDTAGTDSLERRSWASLPSGSGIYETAADTEREARASIGWLRDEPTT